MIKNLAIEQSREPRVTVVGGILRRWLAHRSLQEEAPIRIRRRLLLGSCWLERLNYFERHNEMAAARH